MGIKRIDIRNIGSGNVGAHNTYEVTGSKIWGVIVLAIDLAKGVLATIGPRLLLGADPDQMAACGIAAIVGHNYPVWLRFKGGRGLATTAGVASIMAWVFVAGWCVLWLLSYGVSRNILRSNVVATVLAVPLLATVPWPVMNSVLHYDITAQAFFAMALIFSTLILVRHIQPIREIVQSIHF